MKALSIQQPWAWLIVHAGKDIENRSWSTRQRGRILVHASKSIDETPFDEVVSEIVVANVSFPFSDELEFGGIIGSVEIVDCVTASDSPWFFGPYGFVLANPRPLPFQPCRGRLGFFNALAA